MNNTAQTTNENEKVIKRFGFLDGLALLFIGLKLTNNIDLNWFWTLSPLLLSNIGILAQIIIFIVYLVLDTIELIVKLFKKLFIKESKN